MKFPVLIIVVALLLPGCGGSGGESQTDTGASIEVESSSTVISHAGYQFTLTDPLPEGTVSINPLTPSLVGTREVTFELISEEAPDYYRDACNNIVGVMTHFESGATVIELKNLSAGTDASMKFEATVFNTTQQGFQWVDREDEEIMWKSSWDTLTMYVSEEISYDQAASGILDYGFFDRYGMGYSCRGNLVAGEIIQ